MAQGPGDGPTSDQIVGSFARKSPKEASRNVKLFISYSWAVRKEAVYRMVDYLHEFAHYDIWIDRENILDGPSTYDAMAKGIDESRAVLCFFSNAYAKSENCRREIEYAANTKKHIVPIGVERDFQPVGGLHLIFGGKLRINYCDDDDAAFQRATIDIRKAINSTGYANETERMKEVSSTATVSSQIEEVAITAGVPHFSVSFYFRRKVIEDDILEDIRKTAKLKEGMLLVHGEGGVGKSTLMARLVHERKSTFFKEYGIKRVIWLNCFQWRDQFEENIFYEKLAESGHCMDVDLKFEIDDSGSSKFTNMVRYYKVNNLKCAFILDDVFNGEIVSSFIAKHSEISPPILLVVTRDLQEIEEHNVKIEQKYRRVEGLPDEEIKRMLETTFELKRLLNDEQLSNLAGICCGLPLIADMVASRFKKLSSNEEVQEAFCDLIDNWSDELQNRAMVGDKGKSYKTVLSLLSFSLDNIDSSFRMSYYAFLLFDPAKPVSITDLGILWGFTVPGTIKAVSVRNLCSQFEQRSLIRRVKGLTSNEDRFLVHQTLFEAALEKSSEDFNLTDIQTKDDQLYAIRLKLISGEVNREAIKRSASRRGKGRHRDITDDSGLGNLVDSFKLEDQSSTIVDRIFEVLSPEDIIIIFQKRSPGLTNGESFLSFAYHEPLFRDAIVKKLVSNYSDAIFLLEKAPNLVNIQNRDGHSALQLASLNGRIEIVKYFLEQYPNLINLKNYKGGSVLHNAAFNGHLDIVMFLHDKEPNLVHILNNHGYTALHTASRLGHLSVVIFLESVEPNLVNIPNCKGETATFSASRNGHLDVIKFLHRKEPNLIKIRNRDGATALHIASFLGHTEVVKYLLDIQPNLINIETNDGITALHFAAFNGHLEIVKLLLDKKPKSIDIQNQKGTTALHMASSKGHLNVVVLFLKRKPHVASILNNHGNTALQIAARGGYLSIVKVLYDAEPTLINNQDKDGDTALWDSSLNGHLDIVKFLLVKEPDLIFVQNKEGNTAINAASSNCHMDIVNFLQEKKSMNQLVNV